MSDRVCIISSSYKADQGFIKCYTTTAKSMITFEESFAELSPYLTRYCPNRDAYFKNKRLKEFAFGLILGCYSSNDQDIYRKVKKLKNKSAKSKEEKQLRIDARNIKVKLNRIFNKIGNEQFGEPLPTSTEVQGNILMFLIFF
jgi:hypothetical protein